MAPEGRLWLLFAVGATPLYLGVYFLACRRLRDSLRSKHGNSVVQDKARSWIITGLAACIASIASVPFVVDFVRGGWDATAVQRRPVLAQFVTGCFLSYLFCDVGVGLCCYRSQVAWLTGWGHHLTYIAILLYGSTQGWLHLFALGTIEEFPTAVLAAGILFPRLRSDWLFAASFALTRLVYHVTVLVSLTTPVGQTAAYADKTATLLPAAFYALGVPLHIFWFNGCIRGIIRRRRKARNARMLPPTVAEAARPVELVSLGSEQMASLDIKDKTVRKRIVRGFKALRGGLKQLPERRRFGNTIDANSRSRHGK